MVIALGSPEFQTKYHIMRATTYLHCLITPILAQMSSSFMHAGSSAQSQPPSPINDSCMPGFNDSGDQADPGPAVWKRRYLALQESMNAQESSKRKSG
jgi:hypothetical protein